MTGWYETKKKMRKRGILMSSKEYHGWGEPCPFARGDIYINPKSPTIRVLIVSEPLQVKAKMFHYKRTCWVFDAIVLRNGKSKLQKKRRVFHDDMQTFVRLEDSSGFESEKVS